MNKDDTKEVFEKAFKYKLRRASDGVVLAKSPSKEQAFKTAEVLFDNLTVRKGVKVWRLFEGETLRATIK